MRTRPVALTLALAAAACGGAPPPAPTPSAPSGQATGAPASTPPPASGAAETGAGPTAKVTEVVGSMESTAYMKVTAVFSNPSSAPCSIPKYTLVWSGGKKEIKLDDFTIPPGSSRQRSVKVHPDDGDLKTLTMESARIELPAEMRPLTMPVDLLVLGGEAAAALEDMGYVAVARKRDGVVTVEVRKLVGTRQYVMSHVVDDPSVPLAEIVSRCDAEFRAALSLHE